MRGSKCALSLGRKFWDMFLSNDVDLTATQSPPLWPGLWHDSEGMSQYLRA
jgi:hypothetical protein